MRMLRQASKAALTLLLLFIVSGTAYGQTCTRYLNATDGSDLNSGTSRFDAVRTFEYAWESFPDGSTVCVAAGEYFYESEVPGFSDQDGVQLNADKSLTFKIEEFNSSQEVLFSEDEFVLDIGTGTLTFISDLATAQVVFGEGVINVAANFPGNANELSTLTFNDGTLDASAVSVLVENTVTAINRNTDAAFTATPTFESATRTVTISGDDNATAGGELPSSMTNGTLQLNNTVGTVGGTYTVNKAVSFSNGGMINLTSTGNTTFTSMVTVASSGASMVTNSGSGTLDLTTLMVPTSGVLGSIVDNQSSGAITADAITFQHSADGAGDVTATLLNSGSGTLTTGVLTDVDALITTPDERVLVTVTNAVSGTVNIGGTTASTVGGDLNNNDAAGRVELQGDVTAEMDVNNQGTIDVNTYTLTLVGGMTYAIAGDIVGSGTVLVQSASTIDNGAAGQGGTLPNVTIADGDATIDMASINGDLTVNSGDDVTVTTNAITGDLNLASADVSTITVTNDIGGNATLTGTTSTVTADEIDGNLTTSAATATVNVNTISGTVTSSSTTADINAGTIGGATSVTAGTANVAATLLNSSVTVNGSGALYLDSGAVTTIDGAVTVSGNATFSNGAAGAPAPTGVVLTIDGDLTLSGNTDNVNSMLLLGDNVRVEGMYMQSAGSTLDFGNTGDPANPNTLNLIGDFNRTGGTVIPGNGELRFISEGNQTFQGGPNFIVNDLTIQGNGTNVIINEGSVDVEGDFLIGNNASMELLEDSRIRMVGMMSRITNDGSYTADDNARIVFAARTGGSAQVIDGNGTYSNIEILLASEDDDVLVGSDPGIDVEVSGLIIFTRGGFDLNGNDLDLTDRFVTPTIRRNLNDPDSDGADGKFIEDTAGGGRFNFKNTPYDLEYVGESMESPEFTNLGEFEAADPVRNVSIFASGDDVTMAAASDFSGTLLVDNGSVFNLGGFTLTSTAASADHTVSGDSDSVGTDGDGEIENGTLVINGDGSISGGGTLGNGGLTVNSPNTFEISNLVGIMTLTVTSGDVNVGLIAVNATNGGDINTYSQTGGAVTMTTDLDVAAAGSYAFTGGTYTFGDNDLRVRSGAALTADDPASYVADGTGRVIYTAAGTLNTNVDDDATTVLIPRLEVTAGGGNTVTLAGDSGVSEFLDHNTGVFDLNGNVFNNAGTSWQYASGAGGYGTAGTYLVSGDVVADLDQSVTLPNLTVTAPTAFTIDSEAFRSVTVANELEMNSGDVNQGIHDIILTGAGLAYDYNGGTFTSTGGELVFNAGAAQNMSAVDGLSIPYLRQENDVTLNDVTTFTVTVRYIFGSSDSDLIYALDANNNSGNIAFADGTLIQRDGTGRLVTLPGGVETPKTPVFPTDGTVDVDYLAAVTTSTELPGDTTGDGAVDTDALGTLQINPGAGTVTLDKDIIVNVALNLQTGDFDTTTDDVITMADGSTATRNGATNLLGNALAGGPYTLVYNTDAAAITTAGTEFPAGPSITLMVMGTNDLTLHASRTVASFTQSLTDGADLFDLNDMNLTTEGDATINSGTLFDNAPAPMSTLIVGGDLTLAAAATIAGVDLTVDGAANMAGNVTTGTATVTGPVTIDASFTGNLTAADDVTINGTFAPGFNLTLNGYMQDLTMNDSQLTLGTLTLDQTVPAGEEAPAMATLLPEDRDLTVNLLNLMGGVLKMNEGTLTLGGYGFTGSDFLGFTRNVASGEVSHVMGNVAVQIFQGFTGRIEYPVGSADEYRYAAVTFENEDPAITSSTITVSHVDALAAGEQGFPIDAGDVRISGKAPFHWEVTSSTSYGAAQTFGLEFLGTDYDDYADVRDLRVIRRLDGDELNAWQLQGGTYSNFETELPNQDPLVRVTDTQGGLVAQTALFTFGANVDYSATLAGVNQATPVATSALGSVNANLNGNELVISGTFSGLSSPVDVSIAGGAHIHDGIAGVNGPIELFLEPTLNEGGLSGSFDPELNTFTLPDSSLASLQAESFYVNIHTENFPSGELRGQLLPAVNNAPEQTDISSPANGFTANIAGDPETPFEVTWENVSDPDGNRVVYVWQFSQTPSFREPLVNANTGTETSFATDFGTLGAILLDAGVDVGETATLYHRVVATDGSRSTASETFEITLTRDAITDVEDETELPNEFALSGNYPNPFNPTTTIAFDLPATAEVTVEIVDILGRQVMTVPTKSIEAGANRSIQVDASSLASGIYLYRIIARSANQETWVGTGRMSLVK